MRMIRLTRMILCVLCMAMCSGAAGAQEPVSNFDACVNASKLRHTDSVMEDYLSYKCDGAIAERLAARPDQCTLDIKPSLRRIVRRSKQLADGLYQRMIWSTEVCAGMCETMIYSDGREPSYLCEVRRHTVGRLRPDAPRPADRRYVYEYVPERGYDRPDAYDGRWVEVEEGGRRPAIRWVYRDHGWYLEYDDPRSGFREVYRDDRYYDDRRDDRRDYYR